MLSALLCKPSDRQVPQYRASLLELESYYEVKGLPGPQKELVYNVHNAPFALARTCISKSTQPDLSCLTLQSCIACNNNLM